MNNKIKCLLLIAIALSIIIFGDIFFGAKRVKNVWFPDWSGQKNINQIGAWAVTEILRNHLVLGQDGGDIINGDLIFYENDDNLYFISKKKAFFLAYWSPYAKLAGGCIRKSDGFMLLKGTQIWIPSGFASNDLLEQARKEWKTVAEIDRNLGSGLGRRYYNVVRKSNNAHIGILQERIYQSNMGKISLNLLDGIVLTRESLEDKIEQYEDKENNILIPDFIWSEGSTTRQGVGGLGRIGVVSPHSTFLPPCVISPTAL